MLGSGRLPQPPPPKNSFVFETVVTAKQYRNTSDPMTIAEIRDFIQQLSQAGFDDNTIVERDSASDFAPLRNLRVRTNKPLTPPGPQDYTGIYPPGTK